MEAMEEKVKSLITEQENIKNLEEQRKLAHEQFNAEIEALPGYMWLYEKHKKNDEETAGILLEQKQAIDSLKQEILTAMTEKTHKLECATITKKKSRKLKVGDPVAFYNFLSHHAKGILKKVKYSFPGADIVKLVDNEIISLQHLEPMAEIITTESLAVTVYQQPNRTLPRPGAAR